MELKLGKMTQKELAEWFGITYGSFKAHAETRAKRMEILKFFADYHIEKKSVYIDKIHIPVYSKAYDIVKEEFPKTWHQNGIDTCARVGAEIYYKNKKVKTQVQLTTTQAYTRLVKKELYGRNHIKECGTKGYSEYVWGKILPGGQCEELSPEEKEIVKECSQESYGKTLSDKVALLADAFNKHEITEQEFDEGCHLTSEEKTACYGQFCSLVMNKLGFMPDRLTKLTDKEPN